LAALSLARNPGQATVVGTFLVASLGLALFAVTYRATLLQGQHDEAYYAVPAPYVATEDLSQLVPALHGWHGAPATQVLRLAGSGGVTSTLAYSLAPDNTSSFRPRQPTDGVPLPVLATAAVARAAGPDHVVALTIEGDLVPARVVGVVPRYRSIVGDAVVADRQ